MKKLSPMLSLMFRPTAVRVFVATSCLVLLAPPPEVTRAAPVAPQRRGTRSGVGDPGQFDPEEFLEQFLGKETEQQKRKLAAVEISWDEERRFGEQALQAFQSDMRRKNVSILSRGPEIDYLESLVQVLRPQMQHARRYRRIRVLLADTDDTDARCFPGGTIVIFRGMLTAAQSEATLVAILGHELSHIDHGHQLRHLKALKLAQQTFSGPGGTNFQQMMGNTMIMAQSFAHPFRPEQETEADRDGVTWAYRLGYDPLEFAKLFLRMQRRDERRGDRDWTKHLPSYFRSHPYHHDRYEAVVARVEELKRTEPIDKLYQGRQNLKHMIPRSKREYEE